MSSHSAPRHAAPAEEPSAAVEVENVTHAFGAVDVLDGVSFEVAAGDVACVVGPNGSGKTTLLRLVAGILEPDAGRVSLPPSGERRVGYLAQQPGFRSQFTVAETVEFYGSLVPGPVDAEAVLGRVGLSTVADRRVDALSGGMRRLLGIAQTMVGDPPVRVLDEPASGLDPAMVRHVSAVVEHLAAESDAVVLLSTHDLQLVDSVADTVVVVDHGEVAATGSPEALRTGTDAATLDAALEALTQGGGPARVAAGHRGGDGQ
ncbi:ABC transporter ATP-binding protein [Halobacterium salinarum]|uniref:ABC transporter ATP-binding protein n=1 Tax=Halobacterium salinarum TaxID=2242 RepID=UPI00255488AD|nr:ABC transporter ATP-binding protein [Halobacterium salinarum]MDL0129214.1 ABC transporter ATP-binding protein [Halobacterium salinarum]MDL0137791.1 ABC transporter ATP-binding protein [Halobacterium salinarum]MDL0140811.1 ABC transporter ATP-binding protein [Halobacterium salinarum]